jgi:hypothetical protein
MAGWMKSCGDYIDEGSTGLNWRTGRMSKMQVGSTGYCVGGWGFECITWKDELEGRMN